MGETPVRNFQTTSLRNYGSGGTNLSSESIAFDEGFGGLDGQLQKPPYLLFYIGLSSVVIGILIGLYGIFTSSSASNSEELIIGIVGYVLTALLPIVLLQVIRAKHAHALAANQDEPYDIYAGGQMSSRYLKVVLLGLIGAALPIWVFFLPIAEKFVK
jgi:hypothetical protein